MATAKEDVPIPSPNGTYSASVWSNLEGDPKCTQVIVEFPSGGAGAGVFALDLPHVPLKVRWESDSELVIAHPTEIEPHPANPLARQERVQFADPAAMASLAMALQAMDIRSNPDDRLRAIEAAQRGSSTSPRFVKIRYEQYTGAGHVVAELRRSAESALAPTLPPNLLDETLRGRLVAVDGGQFVYDCYDAPEEDGIGHALLKRGYQGGGESWAGVIYGLLQLKAPSVLSQVRMDPEADGLRVWSSARTPLEEIAELVTAAHADPELLDLAIRRARIDDEME